MQRSLGSWIGGVGVFFSLFTAPALAGEVSGQVRIEGDSPIRRLVVYLEPVSGQPESRRPVSTTIQQRGREFAPGTVVVVQGESVQFVNDEEREIDHNVYSLSRGNSFDIGLIPRGESREVSFQAPGVVKYFCSVHKLMEGAVMVVPSRYFQSLDAPGPFRIADVPPGKWRVSILATHRRYRAEPVEIEVGAGPVRDLRVWLRRRR